MLRLLLVLLSFVFATATNAEYWTLKDSGVGLIVEDENYDKQLNIVERGKVWDAKALYENGAQAGKYRGNQLFAAWIQGPHTKEYLNSYGTPVWMYKYKITYPDGKTFEAGPSGFYTPGFTYFGIKTGGYTNGTWKIDWFIQHRDTKEVRHVATNEFETTYGKPSEAASSDWKAKDIGVGLIAEGENYDTQLNIVERGNVWDAKELYENGAQAGKYRGNQLFAAWIQGPHTKEYLNSYGTPVWMYKYKITYPDGKTFEAGPSGFYTPGFTYFGINTGGYTSGTWKIDWYIQHRDTKETHHVGSSEFKTTYGK
jgi:hypothetical protein